jgi:carboxylesterase
MTASPSRLLSGAEPFELSGTADVGVLLVHGFTGTPNEMRPVAEALAAQGVGSQGILLRGHGTHPDAMVGCRHVDWIEDVERGLDRLLAHHERAVIVGLSMGGTLALNVAARRADDPRLIGLVTIGAPLVSDDWRLRFVPVLSRVIKWNAWGRMDIKDDAARLRHVGYRRFRTVALGPFLALLADTRSRLVEVRQPILIVQAAADHVVPPRNGRLIHDLVSSTDRRVLELQNCYHVATVDFAADVLNDEVTRFIRRLGMPSGARATAQVDEPS